MSIRLYNTVIIITENPCVFYIIGAIIISRFSPEERILCENIDFIMIRTTTADIIKATPFSGSIETNRNNEAYGPRFYAEEYHGPRNGHFGLEKIDNGYNFAIHARDAKGIDFCYQDPYDPAIHFRWSLQPTETTQDGAQVFTGFLPSEYTDGAIIRPGGLYNIRVDRDDLDSYATGLLDPYAKAITRLGQPDHPDSPAFGLILGEDSNIPLVEKPEIDPTQLIIYETHIANSTARNPAIPQEIRGTYMGFAHPANIEYLQNLGITAVEIEPPMQFFSEPALAERGMVNDWGYNTIGFFAPHEGYATSPGQQAREWKLMVNALHQAGIAVIADVVYNHTADGPIKYRNTDNVFVKSPTYSLRGLDDDGYYTNKTIGSDGEQYYFDTTGCGNTIDTSKPAAAQLVRDSLRYWYNEMGIDGARFDLAPSVGNAAFFKSLKDDPELNGCLMIAEPWSFGCGYPKGSFSKVGLPEWNGEFRDVVRDFWRGGATLGKLAYVMAGSFDQNGVRVVNFVTAHDGFTMEDQVSYNSKHNEPNGECNRDGTNDNRSWNHGVEGYTDDPDILELRRKTKHNFINTLFMSRGIPMQLGGDELNHSQIGNNNAYCRNVLDTGDNMPYALEWGTAPENTPTFNVTKSLIATRKSSSIGDPDTDIGPLPNSPTGEHGLDWFNLWGERMTNDDWEGRVMGLYSSGQSGGNGDDSILTYVNGGSHDVQVSLPKVEGSAGKYVIVSDATTGEVNVSGLGIVPEVFALESMSSVVLKRISSNIPGYKLTAMQGTPKLTFPSIGRNIIELNDLYKNASAQPPSSP